MGAVGRPVHFFLLSLISPLRQLKANERQAGGAKVRRWIAVVTEGPVWVRMGADCESLVMCNSFVFCKGSEVID
jgi:hypothetical protein